MKVCVIIPSYKVKDLIIEVISSIEENVSFIYVVDDACPDGTGNHVLNNIHDSRVKIIFNRHNLGVGGAVMAGYKAALEDGMEIMVKIDGDGQMDPTLIKNFIYPIEKGLADYTKGNRFFSLEHILKMPKIRIFGNSILSFMSKFSTGYWNIFDPTNGYTAIHYKALSYLPFEKISKRYFFETDMLFRLNTVGAVIMDVPMDAKYGDEQSNLKISKIWFEFMLKHLRNFIKRIFYSQ